MNTEIPNTNKAAAMIRVAGCTYAIYYVDGKQKRKSLGAVSGETAGKARDLFFEELLRNGATLRKKKTPYAKVSENPDRYIQYEFPYKFVFKGEIIARGETKEEVRKKRDAYFASSNV